MSLLILITFQLFLEVKTQDGGFSTGSAVTSSMSPIPENRSTMMFSSQTSQAALPTVSTPFTKDITTSFAVTSSAEITSDPITISDASSLITRNRHILTDPTKKDTETNKYFNTKMLFIVMEATASGGLVLVGLVVFCLYKCKRRPRAERIWFESTIKKRGGVSIPMVRSGSCGDEEAEYYSFIDVLPYTNETSGIRDEQSKQTEVELSHLYATVSKPAINDNNHIYCVPMP
nr:uncharacterized protein LOC129427927 isoform X2 [Misgurnus anguillicaudatus]